jgi:hypothetical protein
LTKSALWHSAVAKAKLVPIEYFILIRAIPNAEIKCIISNERVKVMSRLNTGWDKKSIIVKQGF